jgi:hypothetical protein
MLGQTSHVHRLTTRRIGHRLSPDQLARPARRNAIPTISGPLEDLEWTREEASALKRGSVHGGRLSLTHGPLAKIKPPQNLTLFRPRNHRHGSYGRGNVV